MATFRKRSRSSEILERIPIVNRIIPAKNIVIPCLEGMVLNTDNEILQNNFIAMLESSMDKTKQNLVHPAFPKILSQLSVDELLILYYVNTKRIPHCYSVSAAARAPKASPFKIYFL